MKKINLFIITALYFTSVGFGQGQQHKIVFDFTKGDTASFGTMARHAKNILSLSPNAKLEIVCYGPGLDLVIKEKTTIEKEIKELNDKYGVVFAACESTMKRRGIDKSQLLLQAMTVPLAILEISTKEQEGWTYIKAGY